MAEAERGTRVVLRDGSEVIVDQVHRTDAPLLVEGFARLSEETRRLRFLTAKPRLSESEVRYFTHVDHHDHEAIGAMVPSSGRGVGLARYIRDTTDPEVAELAVTVADEWQGKGLGTELLRRIMERAGDAGIHRFTALVDADNETMIQVLRDLGGNYREIQSGAGAVDYEVELPSEEHPNPLREFMRTLARRQRRSTAPAKEHPTDLPPADVTGEGEGPPPGS